MCRNEVHFSILIFPSKSQPDLVVLGHKCFDWFKIRFVEDDYICNQKSMSLANEVEIPEELCGLGNAVSPTLYGIIFVHLHLLFKFCLFISSVIYFNQLLIFFESVKTRFIYVVNWQPIRNVAQVAFSSKQRDS